MTHPRFDRVAFPEGNPEPRCAVALVVDVSSSMTGEPIDELNQGIATLAPALCEDPLSALRAEISLVSFGGDVLVRDPRGGAPLSSPDAARAFAPPTELALPTLAATGDTPMGAAVHTALGLLRERKEQYKQAALDYYRPWLFLISDGYPTDSGWQAAAQAARDEEMRKGVSIFPIGVQGADLTRLGAFSAKRPPVMLRGLAFRELFVWLSKSIELLANSSPGDQVGMAQLGPWAVLSTS
ncbi:MAG: hypothetical protein DCC58_12005 [Chloroflexi bacterium]|nr:MAG: hypothetical protein DCC58_12005 [Chloroflexota bacterium]